MIIAALLISGLVLLYFGAILLIRGSARVAIRAGVPSLIVGLTIVAFGTSAPELVVSVRAGFDGLGNIAVGNVVGSNIFNIVIILGLSAIINPIKIKIRLLKIDTPILIAVSVLLSILLIDREITRAEGLILFFGIVIYTVFAIYNGKKTMAGSSNEYTKDVKRPERGKLWTDILYIILGLAGLIAGSQLFVRGAIDFATALNISEAVIGLTIIAAGTSLPELATSVIAAFKGEDDIAIGNVVGSNIFNILAIIGLSAIVKPLQSDGIRTMDIALMIGTAILLMPIMLSGSRIVRYEGFLLVLIYGLYLYYLWP